MTNKHYTLIFIGLLTSLLAAVSLPAFALPYGAGSYGTCTYDTCGITLTDSGDVGLSVLPTQSGVVTIAPHTLTVTTGASTGYTLQLESTAPETTLAGSTQTIAASTGSFASPQSLALNSWGYRLDGLGGFGTGPTSAVTNASSSSLTFAGIGPSGTPTTLVTTTAASPSPGTDHTIWYGVRADTNLVSDTYGRTVLYTATTN